MRKPALPTHSTLRGCQSAAATTSVSAMAPRPDASLSTAARTATGRHLDRFGNHLADPNLDFLLHLVRDHDAVRYDFLFRDALVDGHLMGRRLLLGYTDGVLDLAGSRFRCTFRDLACPRSRLLLVTADPVSLGAGLGRVAALFDRLGASLRFADCHRVGVRLVDALAFHDGHFDLFLDDVGHPDTLDATPGTALATSVSPGEPCP